MMTKKVKNSMRGYPVAVVPFSDAGFEGYRAYLVDIPAVESLGSTAAEAVDDLPAVEDEWFAYAKANHVHIPAPSTAFGNEEFSGRITLRVPRSLHKRAAEKAAFEGVSLNSYLNAALEREEPRHDGLLVAGARPGHNQPCLAVL
jgi:predicted DNA binding CopG/RHH family protein